MKNPFMSMFLSGANRIAGTARAHTAAAIKRETAKNTRLMTKAWADAILTPVSTPKKRKKTPL